MGICYFCTSGHSLPRLQQFYSDSVKFRDYCAWSQTSQDSTLYIFYFLVSGEREGKKWIKIQCCSPFSIIQGQVRLRHFLGRALRLGQARGPSAAATGQVKLRYFLSDPCTKLIGRGGGGTKIVLQEYTQLSGLIVKIVSIKINDFAAKVAKHFPQTLFC